jgi:outer membrane protein TolC
MEKQILVLLLLLANQIIAIGQQNTQPNQFSLQEAQEYSLKNSTIVKNAVADIGMAKGKVQELTRIGFPQITTEAKYQNFIDIPTSLIPETAFNPNGSPDVFFPVQFGTSNNTSASLTATQLIFDGSYLVGLQAARRYLETTDMMAGKVKLETKDQVAIAYYMVLIGDVNRMNLEQTVANTTKTLNETKSLYESGFVEVWDVQQLELALSNIQNAAMKAKSQVKASHNLLKFTMGFPLTDTLQLTESLTVIIENLKSEATIENPKTFEKHIDFQLASQQERLLHLNHRLNKSKRLPTIGAFMSHSQNSFSNNAEFNTWYPTTLWGISIKAPIFSSFMQNAKEKQSKLEWEKAKNNKWQASESLRMQAENAFDEFAFALKQEEAYENNSALAKLIMEKTMIKKKAGMSTSMDVTQSINQYLEANAKLTQARFELLNAKIKLNQATNHYQQKKR